MHLLKIFSILLLIIGVIILIAGLFWYWNASPPYGYISAVVIIGLLFMLGAIILLCVSFQYDMKSPVEQLRDSKILTT